jgi:hypothetical protein
LAEFLAYQSNRIGGTGPNSGLQYNVKSWFPDVPGLAISEDIFADTLQPRVIIQMKILLGTPPAAANNSVIIRAKPIGTVPAIFNPGIDIFRLNLIAGYSFASTASAIIYPGSGALNAGANDGQATIYPNIYLDRNMDFNVSIQQFATQSIQMHYLTGDPDRLMQAVINK